MCHRNQKGETEAQTGNNVDSELNNTNQVETWARELLQDGDDDNSHFSNQVAVVGYKPSFTQNRKAVKEFKNEVMSLLKIMKFVMKISKIPIQQRLKGQMAR